MIHLPSLLRFTLLSLGLFLAGNIQADVVGQLLGPTGLSGKIQRNSFKVTQVDVGSPADGKMNSGDVVIGVAGKRFSGKVKHQMAAAIDQAETKEAGGRLELLLSGDKRVELQLPVLGAYSQITPYNCPKTALIVENAAEYLAGRIRDELREKGKFNSGATHSALLGLLATGDRKYINLVSEAIEDSRLLDPDKKSINAQLEGKDAMGKVGWSWGYDCILLGEYYLLTGDRTALSALETYSLALARGQDAGGLWGHRMAVDGRLPGYAQMNQSSLSCFMGLLFAKQCGINHPDLNAAIQKTYAYYATYIGRGGFNYGVHLPDRKRFNNNGMSGSAAICMALLDNKAGIAFFSGLSATAYNTLEQGHASNFFNPLWTPLGASLSGPEITHRFFKNSLWFLTCSRAWDGSFRRAGKEGGNEGSQTGVALLTYCLPRKALFITGKEQDPSLWLKGEAASKVIEMSQIDYETKDVDALLELFDSPFPQVRVPAVWSLRKRSPDFIPRIVTMLERGNKLQRLSALEYCGYQCPFDQAQPQLERIGAILRDANEDPEIRANAASTLAAHGAAAYAYYEDMLRLIVEDEPGDLFRDVDQSVGRSLNELCSQPYAAGLVRDKRLFYAAARKLMEHKRQHARSDGLKMISEIPLEDFRAVVDKIVTVIEDTDRSYHSYHSWQLTIGPAIKILANLNIEEGIDYAAGILDRDGGKWGFKVRMLCATLPEYGGKAKTALSKLERDERVKQLREGRFRGMWEKMVRRIEEDPSPENLIKLEEALRASGNWDFKL